MASDNTRTANFATIPETEIASAKKFNLPLETWRRQERTFGLLRKVTLSERNPRTAASVDPTLGRSSFRFGP